MLEDSYKHKGMRKLLSLKLKDKGIQDKNVLNAIENVPRHHFFDKAFIEQAYQDKAFPIGEGQTISQPYTVAFQSQLLEIKKGDKVLEVGTGSGYQCCVLIEMGAKVYTIETNKVLYEKTKKLLPAMGYNTHFFLGDGSLGLPAYAPFDKIIVTAGSPQVPSSLIEQLAIGGIIVIPVGDEETQQMFRLIKKDHNRIIKEDCGKFRFVPLKGKEGW